MTFGQPRRETGGLLREFQPLSTCLRTLDVQSARLARYWLLTSGHLARCHPIPMTTHLTTSVTKVSRTRQSLDYRLALRLRNRRIKRLKTPSIESDFDCEVPPAT